jgi:hypothetical protein
MDGGVMMARTVEYHPPESEKLDRFARQVCREMGLDQKRGVVYELAGFMQVLARACAKDLNRKNENGEALDNGPETA